MPRLDPTARVRNRIRAELAAGPVPFLSLVEALTDQGLTLGPDPERRVDDVLATIDSIGYFTEENPDRPDSSSEPLELCFDRVALVEGTTWTVPITEIDLASDTLPVDALGLLFVVLINEWCHLDGGDTIDIDLGQRRREVADAFGADAEGSAAFPVGWLADHGGRPGGYLAFRVQDAVVSATAVEKPPEPSAALVEALASTLVEAPPSRRCRHTADVLTEVLVVHPEARADPLPPLADLVAAAGLVRDGSWLAPRGFDFHQEHQHHRIQDVAQRVGFGAQAASAYAELVEVWDSWSNDGPSLDPVRLGDAVRALEDVAVATVFADEEGDPDHPEKLAAFGEALIGATAGRRRAAPAWLVAQAFGLSGRTERFETWIDTTLEFDPDYLPAVFDKAWFEFDRGEARRAQNWLQRLPAGLAEHDLAILDSVLGQDRPATGRNEPCPCGSGRKYKHCHLGISEAPLDTRLVWMYRKANWWLGRWHRPEVNSMAWLRARNCDLTPSQMLEVDPLIADAVLTEGGRFLEWLAHRGALLPTDEAMLAGQWAMIERSVFEVAEVRPGQGLAVRDVRTGDVLDVDEKRGSRDLEVGRYLMARPVPTGTGGYQFFGGVTIVADTMLHRFIDLLDGEPSPAELLSLVAEAEAPPSLVNRDGHTTVFCESTWVVDDPKGAARALDTAFESSSPAGEWTWFEAVEDDVEPSRADTAGYTTSGPAGEGRTVLGYLALNDSRLTLSTNSVERAQAMTGLVAELLPSAELIEELQSSLDEVRDDVAYEREVFGEAADDRSGALDLTEASPAERAALRRHMDAYEERWVDESIPALGGATPRQALDDPTRRDDLFRLLEHMEGLESALTSDQRALGMRTSRLRELLGLAVDQDR